MLARATMTTNYSKGTTFPYDPSFIPAPLLRLGAGEKANQITSKGNLRLFSGAYAL